MRAPRSEQAPVAAEVGGLDTHGLRVLIVYFTYTQQSRKVAETMVEGFRAKGCSVDLAAIQFTDKRWAERFSRFPFKHAYLDVVGMLPAQMRNATGEIGVPAEAREGDYDLVCIGSPTWFFRPSVPIRSFLESDAAARLFKGGTPFAVYVCARRYWSINFKQVKKLATKQGGEYIDNIHFVYKGGQVRSLLSLLSYFGKGENVPRYLGVKIPPTNLQPEYEEATRSFAEGLAGKVANRTEQQGAS